MVPPADDVVPAEVSDGSGLLGRVSRAVSGAVGAADDARRALLSPSGLRGTALEAAWIAGHLVMYPFGFAEERTVDAVRHLQLQHLPPVQRGLLAGDVEAAGTPILLVHGIVDNRSIFTVLRRGLRRRGFGVIASFNYASLDDIRSSSTRLGQVVADLCEETGYERIHIVGHSMGGLLARYYVQCLGGDDRVHTLVTLGTPHQGTMPANLVPHPSVRALRPTSEIVRELAEPAQCRTRFVAIWSDLDQLMIPKQAAKIVHPDLNARNVLVRGVGHLSLPVDGRVVHEICTTLGHLDHEGETVAAGATTITSASGRRRRTASTLGRAASPAVARA